MRVTFTLGDRDPQAKALFRRLSAVTEPSRARAIPPFPFSLLEGTLRAGFAILERLVTYVVDAVAAVLGAVRRAFTG